MSAGREVRSVDRGIMGKRNWFKVHEEWATSKKLRKVTRRYGPVAAAYRALVLGRAYACSHFEDNPLGEIDCSLQDLADDLYDHHDRSGMWQMMIDVGILTIKGFRPNDLEAGVRIRVIGFNEWQTVKGSSADRKAKSRENKKHADLQGSVTECPNYVTQTEIETDIETENTRGINRMADTKPSARAGVGDRARIREAVWASESFSHLDDSQKAYVLDQAMVHSMKLNLDAGCYERAIVALDAKWVAGWRPATAAGLIPYWLGIAKTSTMELNEPPKHEGHSGTPANSFIIKPEPGKYDDVGITI